MTPPPAGDDLDGNTPIDGERDALIPESVETREELNQFELLNIERAHAWLASRKRVDPLDTKFLRELHRRMFDQTWQWAGTYRKSVKTIGKDEVWQVPLLMDNLVKDIRVQYGKAGKSASELDKIAVRFHHRLTVIHAFPNGNGRHARLATDLLLQQWGRPAFAWREALTAEGKARSGYLAALRAADKGDFAPLLAFARGE